MSVSLSLMRGALAALKKNLPAREDLMPRHLCGRSNLSDGALLFFPAIPMQMLGSCAAMLKKSIGIAKKSIGIAKKSDGFRARRSPAAPRQLRFGGRGRSRELLHAEAGADARRLQPEHRRRVAQAERRCAGWCARPGGEQVAASDTGSPAPDRRSVHPYRRASGCALKPRRSGAEACSSGPSRAATSWRRR